MCGGVCVRACSVSTTRWRLWGCWRRRSSCSQVSCLCGFVCMSCAQSKNVPVWCAWSCDSGVVWCVVGARCVGDNGPWMSQGEDSGSAGPFTGRSGAFRLCAQYTVCGTVECVVRSVVCNTRCADQTINTLWVLTSLVTVRSNRVIVWSCGRVVVWCGVDAAGYYNTGACVCRRWESGGCSAAVADWCMWHHGVFMV